MTYIYSKEELDEIIEEEKGFDNKAKEDLAIHIVARNGDLEGVKYLLENGYKITTNGKEKSRAIHHAVASGNYNLVKFLLEKKSKAMQLDKYKNTPLHYISKNTTVDIVELLIEYGADINAFNRAPTWNRGEYEEVSILRHSLSFGNQNIIDFLLNNNAKLSEQEDENKIIVSLLENHKIKNAIYYIKYIGKSLSDYKLDLERILKEKITWLKKFGYAQTLYEDYNIRYPNIDYDIAINGNMEMIKMLEKNNYDFNIKVHDTPLIIKVYKENEHRDIVDYLLSNPNIDISLTTGNKEKFSFDFYGTGISIDMGNYSSLLLEATNKKNLNDVKRFLKTEEISDIIIFVALNGLFYYHDAEDELVLEYLIENYYDKVNPFKIFSKDKKLTMLDVIAQKYNGRNKNKVLTDFCKNNKVKEYLKSNYSEIYKDLGIKEEIINKEEFSRSDYSNIFKAKELVKNNFKKNKQIVVDFGEKELIIKAITHKKFEFIDSDGKKYKSIPKNIKVEEKDLFKAFKKNLKAEYKKFIEEIEDYLEQQNKSYNIQKWKSYYMKSTFKDLTTNVLWAEYLDDKIINLFFVLEDASLMNLEEEEFKLNNKSLIKVIHPIFLTKEELNKARTILDDYEIEQVVKQVDRVIFKPNDLEKNFLDDFKGTEIASSIFRRRFYKKIDWSNPYRKNNTDAKWYHGSVQEHGIFYDYNKMYLVKDEKGKNWKKNGEVTVIVNFSGHHIKAKLNKQETVKIERVEFSKKFKDIPDYILSEIYHDLTKLLK